MSSVRFKLLSAGLLLTCGAVWGVDATPPVISSLLKPKVYREISEDREVATHASLADQRYSFYAAMLVRASGALTRKVLTDYSLYAKMVPYVDQAIYSPVTHILQIEGGIWKFRLRSNVLFEERGERWIHFTIVGGHFTGLAGDVYFEPQGEKGTAVYFAGALVGDAWPPKFVIERGAEIVFGFTGKRMRSYIESQKEDPNHGAPEGHDQIPRPRGHL